MEALGLKMAGVYFGLPSFQCLGTDVYQLKEKDFLRLPSGVVSQIEAQAFDVACAGFARAKTKEFRLDVNGHIRAGTFYPCFNGEGEMLAFRVIQNPTAEIVYLAGAVKRPEAPLHLIRELTRKIIDESRAGYIVTRTQNPHVVDMLIGLCDLVVPLDRPPEQSELGAVILCGLSGYSDPEDLIVREHYGSAMIGSDFRPRSKNERVEKFMNEIDYFAGDARILIGRRFK